MCDQHLYVESFIITKGGAYGGDRKSQYLTDSVNFRIFIGVYDNSDGGYSYRCKGDSIYVYNVLQKGDTNIITDSLVFSIKMLKNEKKME